MLPLGTRQVLPSLARHPLATTADESSDPDDPAGGH